MGKFIFDGPTLSIIGNGDFVVGGVFSFTATELYSEWVDWAATGDNMKYPPAFRTVGGDPIGGGVYIGAYIFMRNDLGWYGHPPFVGDVVVSMTGNFFPEDPNGMWFDPWPGVTTVITMSTSSATQAIATSGSTFTPSEMATAILAAAQTTPIHSDTKKWAGQDVKGTGTAEDQFRSTLIP